MPYVGFQNGFTIQTKSAIDKRLYLTKAEMLQAETLFPLLPDSYFAICPDDGKLYLYNKNNTPNTTTGKYFSIDATLTFESEEAKTAFETALASSTSFTGITNRVTEAETDITELETRVENMTITSLDGTLDGGIVTA